MYETSSKQIVVDCLPFTEGSDGLVPIESVEPTKEVVDVESDGDSLPDDGVEDSGSDVSGSDAGGSDTSSGDVSSSDTSSGDVSGSDASSGDVSGSDVSGGDVGGGSVSAPVYCTCAYEPKPNLWESDITDYDTTDGLLLLILLFTAINTVCNVYWRRRG